MELQREEYSFEEFIEIARILLKQRYGLDARISEKIADNVWNKMKSHDIRDVINLAEIIGSYGDVDWITEVQLKYGKHTSFYRH